MLENQINSIHNVYHVSDGWNLASISYAEVQDMTVAMDIIWREGTGSLSGLALQLYQKYFMCEKGGVRTPATPLWIRPWLCVVV